MDLSPAPTLDRPAVFVVDDDEAVRDSLALLLETAGHPVETFDGADAFLRKFDARRPGCLIVDLRMPGIDGLELQRSLNERGSLLPVIFLSAFGDVPKTVAAMRGGAMDFMTKPADSARMLERVHAAFELNQLRRQNAALRAASREKLALLTSREREVLALAMEGYSNKEIARRLNISFRTVEVHRSRILLKTGTSNLLGLTHLCAEAAPADTTLDTNA